MTPLQRLWTGTALLAFALVAWLLLRPLPAPPPLVGLRAAAEPALPSLPSPDRPELNEAATLLATSTLWGERATAAAAAASAPAELPPRWWVSGVITVPGKPARAVLHFENGRQTARLLGTGDSLPDGRQLVEVRREGVRLRHTPASLRAAQRAAREAAKVEAAANPQAPRKPLTPIARDEWLPLPRRSLAQN
jgi:hypothetical protein